MTIDSLIRQGMNDALKTLVDDVKLTEGENTITDKLDGFMSIINNKNPKYKDAMIEIAKDIKNRSAVG